MSEREHDKPEKMAYSIPDAAWVLGEVSQNHVRNLLRARELDKVRIGRRVMVTAASIKRFLDAGGTDSNERDDTKEIFEAQSNASREVP